MKKPPTTTAASLDWSNQREVLNTVKESSLAISAAAKRVFEDLRAGKISLADATELSNALGKANGGDSNAIKAVMTEVLLDKMELANAKQLEVLQ